ncbi:tetraacyldisaccharide 4'-kinase [Hydrogenimonas cancrithermarum]|uniref:Tetraacyldisaccharide 4'-kinase n=1 Tax=Hydrogenimonas cancrithermarum TaxID=2993563 RepID=A0ABM8FKD7_9BACT|nr:tetraacyldisaccharide 4'-kinase [Hydrogenimonas cancrithermarum]BDY12133.1 tetraacyldisaccharide 4'-kinase [Hydrogenimonas cancrithermarum]
MHRFVAFFENLFYRPKWYHWSVAFVLLPFSLLYASAMWIRRRVAKRKNFGIPIVSIGNLLVGGSGKTPMAIALAIHFEKPAVILRGYGRKSRGLVVVSEWGKIQADIETSGDEAMLLARSLPKATVIVAEDRIEAVEKAKTMGAKIVFLDDGFSKVAIEKFEILLYPANIPNPLPLPSGPFREFPSERKFADLVLVEGKDFERVVTCEGCSEPMLLVTAIANPHRLEPFLPKSLVKGRLILPDHAWFDAKAIEEAMKKHGVEKILTTEKDAVKLEKFGFDMALLKLKLDIDERYLLQIQRAVLSGRHYDQ